MTVGTEVDAGVAAVEKRVAALEAAGKTDFAKVKAWIAVQWPHFVTWGGAIAFAVKVGALKIV